MARIEDVLSRGEQEAERIEIRCIDDAGEGKKGSGYEVTVNLKRPKTAKAETVMMPDRDKYRKEFVFAGGSQEENEKDTLACVKKYL